MSAGIPDPDPNRTSRPSRGVPPGETPPGESSTGSGAGPYRPLTRGWAKGPLVIICLVAVACALFFLAYAIMLNV
ncbi:membrane protein [Streptomyces sp. RSD-27]|nr:membrane protein [Streptomyces sp. RSD-27]